MGIYCRQDVHQLAVRVGNHHLYLEDPDQADIGVHKIILHENYDSWNMQNDICLLELESVADFSSPVHRRKAFFFLHPVFLLLQKQAFLFSIPGQLSQHFLPSFWCKLPFQDTETALLLVLQIS